MGILHGLHGTGVRASRPYERGGPGGCHRRILSPEHNHPNDTSDSHVLVQGCLRLVHRRQASEMGLGMGFRHLLSRNTSNPLTNRSGGQFRHLGQGLGVLQEARVGLASRHRAAIIRCPAAHLHPLVLITKLTLEPVVTATVDNGIHMPAVAAGVFFGGATSVSPVSKTDLNRTLAAL